MEVNQINQAIVSMAVLIITAILGWIGTKVSTFISAKTEHVSQQIGSADYNMLKGFAIEAWNTINEFFRIHPEIEKNIDSTFLKFKDYMLLKVPGLTESELCLLRDTVAGQMNQYKNSIYVTAPGPLLVKSVPLSVNDINNAIAMQSNDTVAPTDSTNIVT